MRKPMLIALAVCLSGLISGCATRPPVQPQVSIGTQNLILDREIFPMHRQEVITAIKECESQRLRAVMIYGKRRINNATTPTVVEVTCAPNF